MKRILSVVVLGLLAWQPAVALSPKCSELPGRYPDVVGHEHAFAQCWQELDEQPGCHVYRDHYHSDESVRLPDSTTHSPPGECRDGLFEGTLVIEGNGYHKQGSYEKGKRDRFWDVRYGSGTSAEFLFVGGNKRYGLIRHANGLIEEGLYLNGNKHGLWSVIDGNPIGFAEELYEMSRVVNIIQLYDFRVVEEGRYVDGKKHGFWASRGADRGEATVTKGHYVDGKRHGYWVIRHIDGRHQIVEEGSYVDGERNGLWFEREGFGSIGHVREICYYANQRVDCD